MARVFSRRRYAIGCALGLLAAACDLSTKPPEGAQAAVAGAIQYEGPRPRCAGEEIQGQFVFQLFAGEGPSPDEAASPAAERVLFADRAFVPSDCEPSVASITKRIDFELRNFGPRGALLEETSFHLIVFLDLQGDYRADDPFLGQPNRGDVFGAAYESADTRRFEVLGFGPTTSFPNGQTFADLEVAVDAPVRSEVPAFRYGAGLMPLSATATLPPSSQTGTAWEEFLFALTEARLEILPAVTDPHRSALATAGIALSDDPQRGLWSFAIDPERMFGEIAHPVIRDQSWRTPLTILRRVRSEAEQAANIPEVVLVPLPRPSLEAKQVFAPSMDLLVPPVALVDLNPALPVCRIPFLAPGNEADQYEGLPVECQELPTGSYDALVTHGVAGGNATSGVPEFISDTGLRVVGGEFVAQRWRVPNTLGQLLNDQGDGARFMVVDTDTATAPDPMVERPDHGVTQCQDAPDPEQPGMTRPVNPSSVPPACCEPVRHLCGLPLCEAVGPDASAVRTVTMTEGGRPDCVPFLMPYSCCQE